MQNNIEKIFFKYNSSTDTTDDKNISEKQSISFLHMLREKLGTYAAHDAAGADHVVEAQTVAADQHDAVDSSSVLTHDVSTAVTAVAADPAVAAQAVAADTAHVTAVTAVAADPAGADHVAAVQTVDVVGATDTAHVGVVSDIISTFTVYTLYEHLKVILKLLDIYDEKCEELLKLFNNIDYNKYEIINTIESDDFINCILNLYKFDYKLGIIKKKIIDKINKYNKTNLDNIKTLINTMFILLLKLQIFIFISEINNTEYKDELNEIMEINNDKIAEITNYLQKITRHIKAN